MGLATNTLTYTYDGDLLTGEAVTGEVNGSVGWGSDGQRRMDAETAAGDTVAYGYDSQGLLSSMGVMTATYVPTTGQLDTTTLSGVLATYSYDPFGDLAGILYEDGSTAVYEVTYTRDSYGLIETKTEIRSGSTALRCYEYDDADRLADVYDAADSMGCTGTNLESYSYDANGNRNAVTNSAGTVGAGAIVTLLEVDPPGVTGRIRYIIDARNRRVGKRVDGVMVQQSLYGDQLNPVAELDGAGSLASRFVYGTSDHVPDYMVRGGTTYRFLTDQNGNVVGLFNTSTGTTAQTREYDAYGRVVGGGTTEVGFSQPFGFAGGLYDEDTGLVRFGARDYRPEVGSWAAKDPLRFAAGDASLFAYAYSNPVNLVDVTGLAPEWAHDAAWWLDTAGVDDFLVGWGDTVSYGAGRAIRKHLTELDDVVDYCRAYEAGVVAGVVTELAMGGWGTFETAAGKAASRAPWVTNNVFRWGKGSWKQAGKMVSPKWHFHFGGRKLMKYHLPYQAKGWAKHLWNGYLKKGRLPW